MATVALRLWMASSMLIGCLGDQPFNVTRHYQGDAFVVQGADDASCRRLNSCAMQGKKAMSVPWDPCRCQCLPSAPIFRQDIGQCVSSIDECGEHLASFVGPAVSELVPVVLLPDDHQLIHPTAEIALSDPSQVLVGPNLCELRDLKALTSTGWSLLAQLTEDGPAFKAVGGDGKLFLQFSANAELRQQLYNSLILVTVLCRPEPETAQTVESQFCIAFRVAPGISALEAVASQRPSDYIILGLCAGLLGVTYIGAVLIYLLVRWQRRNKSNSHLDAEGGDTPEDDNAQQTDNTYAECLPGKPYGDLNDIDELPVLTLPDIPVEKASSSGPVEKIPTKDVHVEVGVEASHSQHLPQQPVTRQRLYFDPAYLEPEMLVAPPPAALDFLQRLREMVDIAQTRLHQRRFLPALDAIPEEHIDSQLSSPTADDDRFTFLARIPEEGELVDSLAGLYDFDTFRHEMVSKLQRQRRSAPRTPPPPDDWVDETLENDGEEEQEEQTSVTTSPETTPIAGSKFSRAQMLRRVFETEANGTEEVSEESFDSMLSNTPVDDCNEDETKHEQDEPSSPPVIKRTQQLATYVFGEALLSRMANGGLRGSKQTIPPPVKLAPLSSEFSPPKLEKVRRKVFGHLEQESSAQCKPTWDRLNLCKGSSQPDSSPNGPRKIANGYGDVVSELRLKAPPPPSSPSDYGYQSSSDSERSPSSLGHPLKLLRRLLGPRSGSGRRKSHVTRVTLGEWLAQDDGCEGEELVVNFAGERPGNPHAHTLEGSIELGDEENSTASDDADSIDGRVSALR